MSADLDFTGILYFFLLFIRPLIFELAERNSTISSHMVRSKCDLKTHVQNLGYPSPYKSGAQKPFSTTSQLNGNINGLYLRNETRRIDNRASALQTPNKAFIDIRLRPGIATPPEQDRATATGDLHNKFREGRSSCFRDMLADRQTH